MFLRYIYIATLCWFGYKPPRLHLFTCQKKLAGMNYEIYNCSSNKFMIFFSNVNSRRIEFSTEILPHRSQAVGCLLLLLFYSRTDPEMINATMFMSTFISLNWDYFMSIWVITNFDPLGPEKIIMVPCYGPLPCAEFYLFLSGSHGFVLLEGLSQVSSIFISFL